MIVSGPLLITIDRDYTPESETSIKLEGWSPDKGLRKMSVLILKIILFM